MKTVVNNFLNSIDGDKWHKKSYNMANDIFYHYVK